MAHIEIETDRCKGCYFCIQFCPKNVLQKSEKLNKIGYFPAEVNPGEAESCTGCKTCALMCPDTAIEVYK